MQNCFLCHNPSSYTFQTNPLPLRRIAVSHVLSTRTNAAYGVPNVIQVTNVVTTAGSGKGAKKK